MLTNVVAIILLCLFGYAINIVAIIGLLFICQDNNYYPFYRSKYENIAHYILFFMLLIPFSMIICIPLLFAVDHFVTPRTKKNY